MGFIDKFIITALGVAIGLTPIVVISNWVQIQDIDERLEKIKWRMYREAAKFKYNNSNIRKRIKNWRRD